MNGEHDMGELGEKELAYQKESDRLDAELKPKLTDEFLSTLLQAVRTHGWSGDYVETFQFVQEMFDLAGKERPVPLEPFQTW
jgi:hypothetical protein